MFRHVEVHDLAAIMGEHDQNKKYPKCRCGHREEVDRYKFPDVVVQKRPPILRWRFHSSWHPTRYASFRNVDSKLEQTKNHQDHGRGSFRLRGPEGQLFQNRRNFGEAQRISNAGFCVLEGPPHGILLRHLDLLRIIRVAAPWIKMANSQDSAGKRNAQCEGSSKGARRRADASQTSGDHLKLQFAAVSSQVGLCAHRELRETCARGRIQAGIGSRTEYR